MAPRNLGELHESGVLLTTAEAAAVIREVSADLDDRQQQSGHARAPASLDQLAVTEDGQLIVSVDSGRAAAEPMPALASLIEQVLPPSSVRNEPGYAVPASFRMLAPRARGWPPGLAPLTSPGDLAAAVRRYQEGATATALLQGLFERTSPLADVPPAAAAPASMPEEALEEAPEETDIAEGALAPPAEAVGVVKAVGVSAAARPSWRHGGGGLLIASVLLLAFLASYAITRLVWTGGQSAAAPDAARPTSAAHPSQPADDATRSSSDEASRARETGHRDTQPAVPIQSRQPPVPHAPPSSGPAASARARVTPTPLDLPPSTGPVFSPSFAASGSSLVFHAGREPSARLMSADLTQAAGDLELVTLVSDSARNYHPRLSPDGQLLAFDSDREGVRGVYVANRDGTSVRRVSGLGFAAVPSWSPDMRWLAFVRAEPERAQVWNVWLQDRATGALRRLTDHRYGQSWGASWFADSRRLCYSHEAGLVILDIVSGATRTFTSPHPQRLVRTPAVSPDGRRIAFQVLRDGVWLLDVESGAMWRIVEDPTAEEFAWDPAGRRLAYHSRASGEWRIWIAAVPHEG